MSGRRCNGYFRVFRVLRVFDLRLLTARSGLLSVLIQDRLIPKVASRNSVLHLVKKARALLRWRIFLRKLRRLDIVEREAQPDGGLVARFALRTLLLVYFWERVMYFSSVP